MKEINALIPNRHVTIDQSLLAVAGLVQSHISSAYISIDELLITLKKTGSPIAKNITFTTVMISVVILFSINQIEMKNGLIRKKNHEVS